MPSDYNQTNIINWLSSSGEITFGLHSGLSQYPYEGYIDEVRLLEHGM